MTRRARTALQRLKIFEAHDGVCSICRQKIKVGEPWDIDHDTPLALGGADDDDNLRPAHTSCHRGSGSKTSDDQKRIAKAKRQRAKHIGAARKRQKIQSRGFGKTDPQRTATRPIEKWRG